MFDNQKVKTGGKILLISQEKIYPNPHQPRRHFDYDELEGLAESIRANGILQPLCVRDMPSSDGNYELIAGERRLRAARLVGMSKIPCIVMETDDSNSAVFALIENLQRQNLGFFEEANGIARLINQHGMTQEEAARRLGKSQSALSNKLRLLRLPDDMRWRIEKAGLTERHARALLRLENDDMRERALGIMIDKRLNVAETDKLIAQILSKTKTTKQPPMRLFKDVRIFVNTINHAVDTMRKAGIDADSAKSETEEYIEYTVRIPKINSLTVTAKKKLA